MKQHRRERQVAKLQARRKAFDEMPRDRSGGYKRPGSMNPRKQA